MLRGVRGATTVDADLQIEIKSAVIEMIDEILKVNEIKTTDIASVSFTMTEDLKCVYPAKFAREIEGFDKVPLMCYQELNIKNSLEKCIRVLILVNTDKAQGEMKHVYLRGAKILRPDLAE